MELTSVQLEPAKVPATLWTIWWRIEPGFCLNISLFISNTLINLLKYAKVINSRYQQKWKLIRLEKMDSWRHHLGLGVVNTVCPTRYRTRHFFNNFTINEDIVTNTDTHYRHITYSMVQSPSWEANWFPASQENPCISRNPKVHYRTHKRPPPVSILGQPNPVHIHTSYIVFKF